MVDLNVNLGGGARANPTYNVIHRCCRTPHVMAPGDPGDAASFEHLASRRLEGTPMASTIVAEKPRQPRPAPPQPETRESARDALQQSMDRRW
jgi:hypothetical protein